MELVDVGGGGDGIEEVYEDDVLPRDSSSFPVHDIARAISLCFQQDDISALSTKSRKSQADVDLKDIDETYGTLLKHKALP